MDEEFFFPQNVQTSFRFWVLGPTHLKRLAVAPVLGLAVGWALVRYSFFFGIAAAALVVALYAGTCCIPLFGDEQTLLDVGLEIRRHQRGQGRFRHRKEVGPGDASDVS